MRRHRLDERRGQRRGRVVATVAAACLAIFCAYVPITAVAVALPTIGQALHASTSDLTWALDAFVLAMAAFILTGGTLGDLFGRKKVLLAGLVLVAAGAVVGLRSGTSVHLLWTAQAIGGTGAALLLPSSLAVISNVIPDPRRRAPAVGAWASALGIGLVSGPWLASLIINVFGASWHWLFVPFAGFAVIGLAVIPWAVAESTEREGRSIDLGGQLTGVVVIVALVFGVIEGPVRGWGSGLVIGSLAVAVAALACFLAVEARAASPMLDLRLFRSWAFSAASAIATLVMFGLIGVIFLLSLFFGIIQHLAIDQIALRFFVTTGCIMVMGPVAARVSGAIGTRATLTAGLAVAGAGLLVLTGVHPASSLGDLAWRMAVIGVGFGLVLGPLTAAAVASAPPALAGMAGSASNAFRQTGGALGPAILGAVLTSRFTRDLPGALVGQHVDPATAGRVDHLVSTHGLGALGGLARTPGTLPILQASGNAFTSALHTACIIGGAALLAAAVTAVIRPLTAVPQASTGRPPALAPPTGVPAGRVNPAGDGMSAGPGLVGTVRDLGGRPVAGAVVTVTSAEGRQVARAPASPDGRYRVSGLPQTPLTVIVSARDHEPAAEGLMLRAGALVERDFVLTGGGDLSGTVRSAGTEGAALAGAEVIVRDMAGNVVASVTTDGDGGFTVSGASAGTYALTATAPGHLPASREIELDGHPRSAALTLPPEREVDGTVRAPGGETVPGIMVTAADAAGDIVASARTDRNGRYRLAGLGDGEHVLVAGGHQPVSASVEVRSGETASVTVRLGGATAGPEGADPAWDPAPGTTQPGARHDTTE